MLAREVPYIVFPAFRLQEALRYYTLGTHAWKNVYKRCLSKKRKEEADAENQAEEMKKEQERIWELQIEEWEAKEKKGIDTL